MDPAVQAFIDKQRERAEAKEKVMAALGKAKFLESQGKDAAGEWATVAEYGSPDGVEGACSDEMLAMATAFVDANPALFIAFEQYLVPGGNDDLAKLVTVFRGGGFEEEATRLVMFELAKFERKEIGTESRAKLRVGAGG